MLRRRRSGESADPIQAFWAWWSLAATQIAAAIDARTLSSMSGEISAAVHKIHPELGWELSKGRKAQHALCVTSGGNAGLRSLAERWRLSAPATTAIWEYSASRLADPAASTAQLVYAGVEVDLAYTRIAATVDDERQLIDVAVYHPALGALSAGERREVVYLTLDWLLGEDGVERWVGTIDVAELEPADGLPADALAEIVAALAARHPHPSWAIFTTEDASGAPSIVVARRPLKRVEYPLFDQLGVIRCAFADQTERGLPGAGALARLRDLEDALVDFVGDRAMLAAHRTSAGEREFLLYTDSTCDTSRAVDGWLRSWPHSAATWRLDPAWSATRPYA